MLKKNSRIALLALTHQGVIRQGVTEEFFRGLMANLSDSGFQSLRHQLTTKGALWYERRPLGRYVGATERGWQELKDIFPALQPRTADSWHLLAFTQAPKADPQFRNLAEQLRKERWLRLSRGVYTHAFAPSAQLMVLLDTFYSNHVVLSTVAEWKFGFGRATIVRHYGLEALADLYSGISTEAQRLLTSTNQRNSLTYRNIHSITSVITRFEAALKDDAGLLPLVFQGADNAADVHSLVARLVSAAATLPVLSE